MKTTTTIFILTSISFLSCNNGDKIKGDDSIRQITISTESSVKGENKVNDMQELFTDSINNLTIGDCFILKSEKLNKGFVLTRIRKDLYDFTPVTLDSTKKDLSNFTNGNMRMVPVASMKGVVENWGTECLSLMGQEDLNEFLKSFKKVGQLEFKDKAPRVSSSCYLTEYSALKLKEFFKEQEMMWINQNKTVGLDSLVMQK
ncbi:MAG: hypothetical protein JNK50_15670 [Bacteroidia bacterium]|nr:hypothetical protein [Bacteroidia bacterium]